VKKVEETLPMEQNNIFLETDCQGSAAMGARVRRGQLFLGWRFLFYRDISRRREYDINRGSMAREARLKRRGANWLESIPLGQVGPRWSLSMRENGDASDVTRGLRYRRRPSRRE